MKQSFKKCMAAILATIMVIAVIPVELVLANYQNPVTDLSITDLSSVSGAVYNMRLTWTRPAVSSRNDGDVGANPMSHRATNYDIFFRNTTIREAYATAPQDTVAANGTTDGESRTFNALTLNPGSIYGFKVVPWHMGAYLDNQGNTVSQRAPLDTTMSSGNESLYLTDIQVAASGVGKSMTVTWDNPLYDGNEIFQGYRIYYTLAGGDNTPIGENPHVDVYATDKALVRTGTKLKYTFEDPTLQVGKFYAVKVEPLVAGTPMRPAHIQRIQVGTNTYNIAYTPSTREYRTNNAYLQPTLNIEVVSTDSIRLFWDNFPGSMVSSKGTIPLQEVKIYKSLTEDFALSDEVGTLSGTHSALNINYWETDRPKYLTYYKVVAYYYDTNTVEPYTMETMVEKYDPTYNKFDPYMPTILDTKNSVNPLSLDLIWKAFVREPYNPEEAKQVDPVTGLLVDKDVRYNIWVTDDLNNFNDPAFDDKVTASFQARGLTETKTYFNNNPLDDNMLGYKASINQYTAATDTGFETKALVDNKIYYVRIRAVREPSLERSQDAFTSWFIPPLSDIAPNPNMMAKPPLRIKQDAEGLEMITEDAITIQWDTLWFEAYNANGPAGEYVNNWFSKIGVDAAGNLVFGDAADSAKTIIYLNNVKYTNDVTNLSGSYDAIKADLLSAGATPAQVALLPLRLIDLNKASYEIHVVPYDEMAKNGGTYDKYLKSLLPTGDPEKDAATDALWQTITPTGDPLHPDFEVTATNAPAAGNLEPNTAYVIFFRPYVMRDGKKVSHYPSYVSGTTLDVRPPLDVTPVVPKLQVINVTDTTVTVWWNPYSKMLDYEIGYSDLLADYADKGTTITKEDIIKNGVESVQNGITGRSYTITGLFPATEYYFWIRSSANNSGGAVNSDWSNPVNAKTLDLATPKPPKGLGPASKDNVNSYNTVTSSKYTTFGPDYIIIEWMRDYLDINNQEGETKPANTADVKGGDAALLPLASFLSGYMVKFNGLKSNVEYYFRAKTVLTVTQEKDGITRSYSYVVQISDTDEFVDVVEVTVPPLKDAGTGKMLRKESDWTDPIKLRSGKADGENGGEYDGNKSPETYPLPSQDFEITYDAATQTLIYRFRSDKRGADGLKDNMVDQRMITRLVADKTYTYTINMPSNIRNVQNRTVEMPYSVFAALNERKIDLRIIAGETKVTLPFGCMDTAQVNGLSDLGNGSTIKIHLKTNASGTPAVSPNQSYGVLPQHLSINVTTSTGTVGLTNLSKPVQVDMTLLQPYQRMDRFVSAYVADANTGGWQVQKSTFDTANGTISMETTKLGHYTALVTQAPARTQDSPYNNAMYTVTAHMSITDMGAYTPDRAISASEFNNLVAAMAYDRPTVNMMAPMSNSDFNSLGKAKLLISGANVSTEAGVNTLVRLYELKTKAPITDYYGAEQAIPGITSAAAEYQTAMLKADAIGFFGKQASVDPKANMTLGQVMLMLSIIIDDAGLK